MDGWEASHQIRKVQGLAQIDEINAMVARYLGFVQTVRQVSPITFYLPFDKINEILA